MITFFQVPVANIAFRWWLTGFIISSVVRANSYGLGPSNPNAFGSQAKVVGDLILTDKQYNYFYGPRTNPKFRSYRPTNPTKKWDQYYQNGRYQIAYEIVGHRSWRSAVKKIMRAVQMDFLIHTNIWLRSKDTFRHHKHWIKIVGNHDECSSKLGRINNVGGQEIRLGKNCLTIAIAAHELMHALGWHHEQNRADRDDYVSILWHNIIAGKHGNFAIAKGSNSFGTPYDVTSLMHYTSGIFALPGKQTMRSKGNIKIPKEIQENRGLSRMDAYEINQVYKTHQALRSGDTISMRSMCAYGWVSNYCTINCGEKTRPGKCAGTMFTKSELKKCESETLVIVAEGRARGDPIHSGDAVGFHYAKGHWLSCPAKDGTDCSTRTCPGALSKYTGKGWRWPAGCFWEYFHIEFAQKNDPGVIHDGDEIAVRRVTPGNTGCQSQPLYLSEYGKKISLRGCPGCNRSTGRVKKRCGCEAFRVYTHGFYYS